MRTLALIDVKPDTQVGLFNLSRDTNIEIPGTLLLGIVIGLIIGKLFLP